MTLNMFLYMTTRQLVLTRAYGFSLFLHNIFDDKGLI
jgi:hypothetical protein